MPPVKKTPIVKKLLVKKPTVEKPIKKPIKKAIKKPKSEPITSAKLNKTIEIILKDPVKFGTKSSVQYLETILRKLSYIYYNTGDSIVPDNVYDKLEQILKERDPSNPFLKEVGSRPSEEKMVDLPYYMSSIDKKKTEKELENWIKKYTGPYVLSDKLDGASGLLVKKDNSFKLYSRGDHTKGQDLSHLIPFVIGSDVKMDLIPDNFAVRGELIISKENFKKIEEMTHIEKKKNGRNLVAGLINSKHITIDVAELTDFVVYSVVNPRYKQSEQMKLIKKYGFNVVNNWVEKKLSTVELAKTMIEHRQNSSYEIDGIIIIDDNEAYELTDSNPDYAIAFKTELDDQTAITTIIDVVWKLQKDGQFSVKILITPVILLGSEISQATAKNAKFVQDNKLGPGAVIKIVKSGDIIPNIAEIIKPAPNGAKMPSTPYKWNSTGVSIIAQDLLSDQKDQIAIQRMVYFFETLNIKYISEGIITKLVNAKYTDVFTFLSAKEEDIVQIEGIGSSLYEKIMTNTNTILKNTKLNILMAASGCFDRGLGRRKIKLVTDEYPNIMTDKISDTDLLEKIKLIDGYAEKTAQQFVDGFKNFKPYFEKLNKIIDLKYLIVKVKEAPKAKEKENGKKELRFAGEKVVFTGFRNKLMEELVENEGGKISGSVSKNTTLVVYSSKPINEPSSKLQQAKDLGIKTMSEDEFKDEYLED